MVSASVSESRATASRPRELSHLQFVQLKFPAFVVKSYRMCSIFLPSDLRFTAAHPK